MVDLAETVAEIHAAIPVYEALSADAFYAAIRQAMLDNFDFLHEGTNEDDVRRLQSWTRQSLDECRELMIARYESGFVRECHGDLYLRNLIRLPSGIVPYDCVEFSVELRNIDVISDVSFLVMDLMARGEKQSRLFFHQSVSGVRWRLCGRIGARAVCRLSCTDSRQDRSDQGHRKRA